MCAAQFGVLKPDAQGTLSLRGLQAALGPGGFNCKLSPEETALLHAELCSVGNAAQAAVEAAHGQRQKKPPVSPIPTGKTKH